MTEEFGHYGSAACCAYTAFVSSVAAVALAFADLDNTDFGASSSFDAAVDAAASSAHFDSFD